MEVVFEDGGSVIERSLGSDGLSFGYEVIAGQSTMTGYKGSVTLCEIEGQTMVVWKVSFEPLADGCYEGISTGFIEKGLSALAQFFNQ